MSREHDFPPDRDGAGDPWPVVETPVAAPPGAERVEVADEVVDAAPRGRAASFAGAPPLPRWRQALARIRQLATSLAFVVGLAWLIAPGGFGGGWFLWALLGIFLAPIAIYVGFVVLLGVVWTRSARKAMREAQRRAGGG